jgi:hypothetical protein
MQGMTSRECVVRAYYTVEKVSDIPVPSWDVTNQTLAGIIKLILPRESLVSDIPAGDGNVAKCIFGSISFHGSLAAANTERRKAQRAI